MITKLNGKGLTSDEFNERNDAREDGTYGIDDDMVMTVCQWYMSPSKADDVMSKAGHGLVFSTDDLALWLDENVFAVEDRDWDILTRWLAEQDEAEAVALQNV